MKAQFQGLEKYSLSNCPMKDLKDRALELKDKLDKDSKEAGEVEILQAKLKENFLQESLCVEHVKRIDNYCNRI